MAKAQNREQYKAAWKSHINQLIHPFLDSGRPIADWEQTRARLLSIVEEAADNTYCDKCGNPLEHNQHADGVCGKCHDAMK